MKCEEVLPLMHRQVDGDLAPDEQEILSRHLSTCAACREQFEELQALSRQLESLPQVDPPRRIVDHMQESFREVDRNREIAFSKRRRKRRYWLSGLVTAAALFLVVWIAHFAGLGFTSLNMQEAQEEPLSAADMPTADGADDSAAPATEAEERASGMEEKLDSPVGPLGEKEEYMSPDGTYTAYLGYEEEDIRIDQAEQAYFLWVHPRDKSWQVEWMEWVADDELYYILIHPQSEEREYWLIRADERVGVQLEEPHSQSTQEERTQEGTMQEGNTR